MLRIRNQSRKHNRNEQVLNTGSESFMLTPQSYEMSAREILTILIRAAKSL